MSAPARADIEAAGALLAAHGSPRGGGPEMLSRALERAQRSLPRQHVGTYGPAASRVRRVLRESSRSNRGARRDTELQLRAATARATVHTSTLWGNKHDQTSR